MATMIWYMIHGLLNTDNINHGPKPGCEQGWNSWIATWGKKCGNRTSKYVEEPLQYIKYHPEPKLRTNKF